MRALYFVPLEVRGFKTHTEQFLTANDRSIKKLTTESYLLDLLLFSSVKQKLLLPLCFIRKMALKLLPIILDLNSDCVEISVIPYYFELKTLCHFS